MEKGSVFMKKAFRCILMLLLMIGAFAIVKAERDSQITDTLLQAGVTEPVQLSQWGNTAACVTETERSSDGSC